MLKFLESKRLVHWGAFITHTLLADSEGNAVIVEVGKDENELVPIEDGFIVMTNFKNSDFRGQEYYDVIGTGGTDRYRRAYEYIMENKDSFDIDNAFDALKMTTGSTLCSMVFKPEENSIYLALERNFDKLWKISIDDKTIETFRGFDESLKFHMPTNGILAADLANSDFSSYQPYSSTQNPSNNLYLGPPRLWILTLIVSVIGLLVLALFATLIIFKIKRRKPQNQRM